MDESATSTPPPTLEYARPRSDGLDWIRFLAIVLPPSVLIPLGGWMIWFAIFSDRMKGGPALLILLAVMLIVFGMGFPLCRLAAQRAAQRFDPLPKEPLPWHGPGGKATLVEKVIKRKGVGDAE